MTGRKRLRIISLAGLALWLAGLFGGMGCSKGSLVKETPSIKRWSCDRQADQALKRQDYETCILLHKRFLAKEPLNGLAMYHLGYAYGQIENHEKEIFYYEKAISLGFDRDGIFFNLGMAYGEMDRIEESIRTFIRALDIDPDNSDNHFGLAMAYQRNSSDILAEKEFLKAIEIDSSNVDAMIYLGMLYMDLNEPEKAREQLRKIMEIEPGNSMARDLLRRIERR